LKLTCANSVIYMATYVIYIYIYIYIKQYVGQRVNKVSKRCSPHRGTWNIRDKRDETTKWLYRGTMKCCYMAMAY